MNDQQLLRYSRQIMLPEVDIAGQERLLGATVLVLGLGGLGSPIALYLTAAGVGTLLLADPDRVDESNLQRQIAHQQEHIGELKVASAARTLRQLRPDVAVEEIPMRLEGDALADVVARVDMAVDATDNLSARYALNRACIKHRVPWISGAAIRFEGQITAFDPRNTQSPCYNCLYPNAQDMNQNCSENGVIAPLVGVIGSVQALEALKLLAHFGEPLVGSLLLFDAKRSDWHRLKLPRNPNCAVCGSPGAAAKGTRGSS